MDDAVFMRTSGGYGVLPLVGRNNCCQNNNTPSPINVYLLYQLCSLHKASFLLGDVVLSLFGGPKKTVFFPLILLIEGDCVLC